MLDYDSIPVMPVNVSAAPPRAASGHRAHRCAIAAARMAAAVCRFGLTTSDRWIRASRVWSPASVCLLLACCALSGLGIAFMEAAEAWMPLEAAKPAPTEHDT